MIISLSFFLTISRTSYTRVFLSVFIPTSWVAQQSYIQKNNSDIDRMDCRNKKWIDAQCGPSSFALLFLICDALSISCQRTDQIVYDSM